MTDITLNQNVAQCLRSQSDFGGTTIHNLCSGATTYVPWGSADWALAAGLIALCAAFTCFLAGAGISMWRMR